MLNPKLVGLAGVVALALALGWGLSSEDPPSPANPDVNANESDPARAPALSTGHGNPFQSRSLNALRAPRDAPVNIPELPPEPPAVPEVRNRRLEEFRARRNKALGLEPDASREDYLRAIQERPRAAPELSREERLQRDRQRELYVASLREMQLPPRQMVAARMQCERIVAGGGAYNDCMGIVPTVPPGDEAYRRAREENRRSGGGR